MHKLFLQSQAGLPAAQVLLTRTLRVLAIYLIPIGIGLLSLLALLSWHDQYRFGDNLPLAIRVVAQDAGTETPEAALTALRGRAPVSGFSTHLAPNPFWFAIDTVHRVAGPEVLEFPSRHAVDIACWDTAGMTILGAATRNTPNQAAFQSLVPAKAGFALQLPFMPSQLLCRGTFSGPARLTVIQWPADQFALSIDQFHRKSGVLDGGMIALALFALIIGAIHRQALYAVFAGWLILNLRIGAASAGWDVQWLGQLVPPTWLAVSRSVTVVLYAIVTIVLYQMLLRDHLVHLRQRLALRFVQWLCLPMLALGLVLPYRDFVPLIWVVVAAGMAVLTLDLVRIISAARTRVALYFAASLMIAFAAGLADIIAGALDMRELAGAIDSVTAALASSLFAALAVAEQMRLELERRVALHADYREAWDAVPAGLFTLDLDGLLLSCNPAVSAMLGAGTVSAGSSRWQQLFGDSAWRRLHEGLASAPQAEFEIHQPGHEQRFMVRATLADERIIGVLENITEQSREIDQLRFMAHRDPLTGVANRRGMEQIFLAAGATLALGRPMAMAFLDFDRFKLINELYGHAAGDEVLKQACERIGALLVGGQHLGRINGDAFLVAMPDTTMEAAARMCRGIVERVGLTPYLVGDKAFTVRASLGLVEVTQGMHMADAVTSADRACRAAKAAASDGVVAHRPHESIREAHDIEKKLVARLSSPNATEGLFLEMQPVMAMAAPHDALSVEVLLRMRETDGSIVDAERIIAAAEKSGRAGVIDRWVLATTLEWIERHAGELPPSHFVCMKLSGAALNDEHFVQNLLASLRRYAHVAAHLCLGIPERIALHDIDNTRRFIERVRVFGVKIALDEFGAGASPFSYLKAISADLLKIDATFIAGIAGHPANAAIVEAIVCLADNLGMKTIAAGAHDTATVRTLARIGIDYVQGDAVARSQPLDAILTARAAASLVTGGDVPEVLAPN